jgi:hypothetical protein
MITLEQAKNLKFGQILYHVHNRNADGTAQRWCVNGKVRTWKRSPEKVYVPLKYGMYGYGRLWEHNLDILCLSDPTVE